MSTNSGSLQTLSAVWEELSLRPHDALALAKKRRSDVHSSHTYIICQSQIHVFSTGNVEVHNFQPFFFFCVCIDLFYSKSAFHLTFKIEVSMVQQLPKPLPSHNYGTVIQVCLTANLGQEVLQIYCSCFFINYQQLQLLDFKRDQYSKGTLSAD